MRAETTPYAFERPGVYARGWHIVCFSQELKPGDIRALEYFDQEFVLFRAANGRAAMLDAYCPHLGAHLAGTGSRVVGDSIRCPFHGWQFDTDGRCTDIPYAKKIPEKAHSALKPWPLTEKNGFIAMWWDPEGGEPNWELPDIPEWNQPGWGDWRFNRKRIRAHGREIIENIVDAGHFPSVHGGRPLQFDNVFTRFTVSQESRIQPDLDLSIIQPSDIEFNLQAMRAEKGVDSGDGPINKLRKWYNRFYLPRAEEAWNEPPTIISSVRD